MFNNITRHYDIKLPDPIPCGVGCKGTLVPIFRPKEMRVSNGMDRIGTLGYMEGYNEVIWKCSSCEKETG